MKSKPSCLIRKESRSSHTHTICPPPVILLFLVEKSHHLCSLYFLSLLQIHITAMCSSDCVISFQRAERGKGKRERRAKQEEGRTEHWNKKNKTAINVKSGKRLTRACHSIFADLRQQCYVSVLATVYTTKWLSCSCVDICLRTCGVRLGNTAVGDTTFHMWKLRDYDFS